MANPPEPPTVTSSAREIFLRALDSDDLASRETLLDSACGEQPGVRREVEEMLAESEVVGDFLESPALVNLRGPSKVALPSALVKEGIGDEIGPFKLLEPLGEGGCGMVYAAEQSAPVRRMVALKVIKLGMDTRSVIARFESERQALAMMDHPNIAKVFDAGATDAGRPYFVMELVRGVPITDFCDQQKLSTSARLRLFILVCNAIQHAHQKGIIHRDIKPSNILIAEGDHGPAPKVIDFGIAKATEQRLTEQTLFTAVEAFIGTPTYMSPEQAEIGGIDIDTRSDIYSLGVLLYELLVGQTPFDASELQRLPLDEMRRTIRETEPERPSQKFAKLAVVEKQRIADCHDCEPAKLSSLLRGDLDWIVIECLEKDRSRRYAAASDLVADIERHLSAQPVLARPPSTVYRVKKMFRRHGGVIVAGCVLLATLLTGIAVSTTQAIRATRAEKEAIEGRAVQERLLAQAERGEQRAIESAVVADLNEYVADINVAQQALAEGNFGRARQLIDKHRPEPGEVDHRGFEWRYLSNLCLGDPHVALPNQGSTVQCLAYSEDGETLAVGLRDEVRLWDVRTQKLITRLPGGASSLLFLRDGKTLVSANRQTTWVVDTSSWLEVVELRDNGGPLALSPDGTQLATVSREGVRIWDTKDWFELLRLPTARAGAVAFSSDGKSLAAPEDGGIGIWSLEDGRLVRVLADSAGLVDGVAFSADGEQVIAPRNGNSDRGVFVLSVWDAATGEEIRSMTGHSGPIGNLSSHRTLPLMTTSSLDHSVGLWDLATHQKLVQLSGHRSEVWWVALSPDGHSVASGSKDGDVRIWPTSPPVERDMIEGGLVPLKFSADGRRLAALGADGTLELIGLPALDRTIPLPASPLASMSADLDTLALARDDGSVDIVNANSQERRTAIRAASKRVDFLHLCADGDSLLSQSGLEEMKLWDLDEPGKAVMSLRAEFAVVSADGDVMAGFGIGDRVEIWSISGRRKLNELAVPQSFGFSAALSSDGRLMASSGGLADSGNQVGLWDTGSGEQIGSFAGHKQSIRSVAFTPDGRTLATASGDGALKLWNVATRQELLSIRRLGSSLRNLMFSPDGQWLVGSSVGEGEGELRLLSAPEL